MKDKEKINISTSKIGNRTQIKCLGKIIHIDTIPLNEVKNVKEEKQAIKDMKNYLKNELNR